MIKKYVYLCLALMVGSFKIALGGELSDLTRILVGENRHIYTKEVTLQSGERAYFACEPIIDKDRSERWGLYRDLTNSKVQLSLDSCLYLLKKHPESIDSMIKEKLFEDTKTHQEEFLRLVHSLTDIDKTRKVIQSIKSGCVGMHTEIGAYVSYISKKPVTGFFPLPESTDVNKEMDLDTYITTYGDLVITVSSYPMKCDPNLYQHRGIFRHPWSVLKKDYPSVALLVHSFTALTWSEEFPDVEFMTVDPDGNMVMRNLLMDEFNSAEMQVKSLDWYKDRPEEYEKYQNKFPPNDEFPTFKGSTDIVIRVNALKNRFPLQ